MAASGSTHARSLHDYVARANRSGTVVGCGVLALAALYPMLLNNQARTLEFLFIGLYGILALGLNLTLGYAGEFALGQAGLFAVGAYIAAMLTTNAGWSFWAALPVATLGAGVAGAIVGLPGLRVGGWYFALTTLYIAVVIPEILQLIPGSGGDLGLGGIPIIAIDGHNLTLKEIYLFVLFGLLVTLVLIYNLVKSGWGLAFLTMSQRNPVAEALGISVVRMKLIVYVLAALCAGFAGAIFPFLQGYLAPSAFPLSLTIMLIAAVVIGGLGSLLGSVVGVAIMQLLPNIGTNFEKYALLVYGVVLIGAMYLIPDGAVPTLRRLWVGGIVKYGRWRGKIIEDHDETRSPTVGRDAVVSSPTIDHLVRQNEHEVQPVIVEGASKHFGGVQALRDVSLAAQPGAITAVIGANGSGKTTLLNVILGFYRLDNGRIRLGDRDLTHRPPWRRARAGMGRTFQTPVVVPTRTALENVAVGRFSARRALLLEYLLRLPRARRDDRNARTAAMELLAFVGLHDVALREADALSPGQQRLLEIARALAHAPIALLLDEPAAGLVGEEIEDLAKVLRDIAQLGLTVVLVEHNVRLVTSVANKVIVLKSR